MSRIIPNFFIVGAPKCGTTSLSSYLSWHEKIFVSKVKEPHYFASDLEAYRPVKSFPQYQRLFLKCSDSHLAVGEASTWYLYSKVAIRNIYDYNPASKLIVMIRNPIDLVYSLHSQLVYSFHENQTDFYQAWNLQKDRSKGKRIPRSCRQPELLQYAQVGMLAEQVERLYQTFPQEQVKIILFDDFIADTKRIYEEVLNFLRVPFEQRDYFPRMNENKAHRIQWLGRILQKPSNKPARWLVRVDAALSKFPGFEKINFKNRLLEMNLRTDKRAPLDVVLREELAKTFRADVQRLSLLLGKDLNHWTADTYSSAVPL